MVQIVLILFDLVNLSFLNFVILIFYIYVYMYLLYISSKNN